ncbi:hypothetical protein PM082_013417 [Marasmius tenuissimus]|nr:hypothetical protein PM082_013417 [Marasmius tenuissimus]
MCRGSGQPVAYEDWVYHRCEYDFRRECYAYDLLSSFQGTMLPMFYGYGTIQPPGRLVTPHYILLEYLPDPVKLSSIGSQVRVEPSLCRQFAEGVRHLAPHGVIHSLNPADILIPSVDTPTRIVLIDFTQSVIRKEHLTTGTGA